MRKALAAAVLSMFAMGSASAEVFYFGYKGFYDNVAEAFDPDRWLTGSFVATDADGNGAYFQDELNALEFGALTIGDSCTGTSDGFECLTGFSYWPRMGLNFHAISLAEQPDSYTATGVFIGQYYQHVVATPDSYTVVDLGWTPQTRLYVSTSPVPEPGTWAMLGGGLGGLLLARRRRPA